MVTIHFCFPIHSFYSGDQRCIFSNFYLNLVVFQVKFFTSPFIHPFTQISASIVFSLYDLLLGPYVLKTTWSRKLYYWMEKKVCCVSDSRTLVPGNRQPHVSLHWMQRKREKTHTCVDVAFRNSKRGLVGQRQPKHSSGGCERE